MALGAACLAALTLFGVGCSAWQGTGIEITDGKAMFSEGDLKVELDANPTTGYEWTCEIQGDAVTAEGDDFVAASDGGDSKAGEGGTQTFSFKAAESGEATITFAYARSWEPTDDDKVVTLRTTVENGRFASVVEQ